MLKFITNFFSGKQTRKYVYKLDKEGSGVWVVYAKDYPHISGSGLTKEAALECLKEDLRLYEGTKLIEKTSSVKKSTVNGRPKNQVANA